MIKKEIHGGQSEATNQDSPPVSVNEIDINHFEERVEADSPSDSTFVKPNFERLTQQAVQDGILNTVETVAAIKNVIEFSEESKKTIDALSTALKPNRPAEYYFHQAKLYFDSLDTRRNEALPLYAEKLMRYEWSPWLLLTGFGNRQTHQIDEAIKDQGPGKLLPLASMTPLTPPLAILFDSQLCPTHLSLLPAKPIHSLQNHFLLRKRLHRAAEGCHSHLRGVHLQRQG